MSSRLRSRLGALREIRDLREATLLARLIAFAAIAPLLMRLPLPRVASVLARSSVSRRLDRTPSASEIERLERLVVLAPRVAGPLVRTGCLTRGLTLFWFLRRGGLDVELCFGLDAGQSAAVDGHCWLSVGGEPFLEPRDPRRRFQELYRLPLTA